MGELRLWIGDGLVLASLVFSSIAVLGLVRLRDDTNRVHSAGQALLLGVLPVLLAALLAAEAAIAAKILTLAVFLLITGPVSSHVLASVAHDDAAPRRSGERR